MPLPGFPSNLFAYLNCIHENSAEGNASLRTFLSGVLCELIMDIFLIKRGVNRCGLQICGCQGNFKGNL